MFERLGIQKTNSMKLITTQDYLLGVDDSGIKEGDLILYKNSSIAKCLGFPTDGGGGLKIQIQSDIAKIKTDFESCKKIIAHLPLNNSPILEGVDLLPPLEQEDDVEKLAFEYTTASQSHRRGFIDGYNKATNKYDVIITKLFDYLHDKMESISQEQIDEDSFQLGRYRTYLQIFEFIQSLSQPKMPVEFEIESTTTNAQGQTVLVGTYKY